MELATENRFTLRLKKTIMNNIPSAKECARHGVKRTIQYFVAITGLAFNPDNDFGDYDYIKPGHEHRDTLPVLDQMLQECHDMCDKYELDIYEISLEVMQPLIDQVQTA
jgi:hypothetical protein